MAKLNTTRIDRVSRDVQKSANEINALDEKYSAIQTLLATKHLPGTEDVLVEIDPQLINTDFNLSGRKVLKDTEKYRSFLLSIETDGLLQPPTVYYYEGKIVCKYGNHRIEACKDLNYKTIKCIFLSKSCLSDDVDSVEDEDRKFMENHQNKKNPPLVYSEWIKKKSMMNLSNDQIAKRLGKDREWVRRYLKISEWPRAAKDYISQFEEYFNQSFLHGLAKKAKLNEEELLSILRSKVTGKKEIRQGASLSRKEKTLKSFEDLCQSDPEFTKYKPIVQKALKQLNLI